MICPAHTCTAQFLSETGPRKHWSENPIFYQTVSVHMNQFFIRDKNSDLPYVFYLSEYHLAPMRRFFIADKYSDGKVPFFSIVPKIGAHNLIFPPIFRYYKKIGLCAQGNTFVNIYIMTPSHSMCAWCKRVWYDVPMSHFYMIRR